MIEIVNYICNDGSSSFWYDRLWTESVWNARNFAWSYLLNSLLLTQVRVLCSNLFKKSGSLYFVENNKKNCCLLPKKLFLLYWFLLFVVGANFNFASFRFWQFFSVGFSRRRRRRRRWRSKTKEIGPTCRACSLEGRRVCEEVAKVRGGDGAREEGGREQVCVTDNLFKHTHGHWAVQIHLSWHSHIHMRASKLRS